MSSTSVGVADENDLSKMRQTILTAKKIKRDADQIKETISSLDEEVEVLIKKRRKQILVHMVKKNIVW